MISFHATIAQMFRHRAAVLVCRPRITVEILYRGIFPYFFSFIFAEDEQRLFILSFKSLW